MVYLICINEENYILKISNNDINYSNEKKIYHFFNDKKNSDEIVNNNIIKSYDLNEAIIFLEDNKIQLNCKNIGTNNKQLGNFILDNNIIPNLITDIENIEKVNPGNNIFILLEKKIQYIEFTEYLTNNHSQRMRQTVIYNIIKILYHLMINYGFNHNDLHSNNLLINEDNNQICLFDFDLSLLSNENNRIMDIDINHVKNLLAHQIKNRPPTIIDGRVIARNDYGRLRRQFINDFSTENIRYSFGLFYDISKILIAYKSIPNNFDRINIILNQLNTLELGSNQPLVNTLCEFVVQNYINISLGHRYNVPIIFKFSKDNILNL